VLVILLLGVLAVECLVNGLADILGSLLHVFGCLVSCIAGLVSSLQRQQQQQQTAQTSQAAVLATDRARLQLSEAIGVPVLRAL
jgi:membrane associated rhomboid family serine protease